MRSRFKLFAPLIFLLLPACGRKPDANASSTLEKGFQDMMAGVTLVGHSTRVNQEGLSGEEKYVIDSVSKLAGDTWLFHARLQYGSRDLPIAVPVTIKWAGDTPVHYSHRLNHPRAGNIHGAFGSVSRPVRRYVERQRSRRRNVRRYRQADRRRFTPNSAGVQVEQRFHLIS